MFEAKFFICSLEVDRKSQKFSMFSVVAVVDVVPVVVVDAVVVDAHIIGINLARASVAWTETNEEIVCDIKCNYYKV